MGSGIGLAFLGTWDDRRRREKNEGGRWAGLDHGGPRKSDPWRLSHYHGDSVGNKGKVWG